MLGAGLDLSPQAVRAVRGILAGTSPTLDLSFLYGYFDPRITFTRASVGTYFDSTGVMRTAAAGVPRFDYDPATLLPRGLLIEEARTNSLLNSSSLATQSATVTAVPWTLSFWGTGTATLSGASTAGPLVGTGAGNRVALTFTPTAGSLTVTVSGSVTNAQLELGGFATSYIPTAGATVTRAADVATVGTLAPWFNAAEGTLAVETTQFSTGSSSGQHMAAEFGDGSINNLMQIGTQFGATNFQTLVNVGGVAQALVIEAAIAGAVQRRALAYKANDFAIVRNGGTVSTDTSGTVPAVTNLYVGNRAGIGQLNGHIRRLRYFPTRLTNAQLQGLTA